MKGLLLALACVASACAAPLNTDLVMVEMTLWEGHRLTPYPDAGGWSVGIGHSLTQHGEPVKRTYTRLEVRQLFYHDLAVAYEAARAGVSDFDDLPDDVRLLTLGVIWGVGPTGFERFRAFRLALSYRSYDLAANELGLSRWYQQVSPRRANAALHTLRSH